MNKSYQDLLRAELDRVAAGEPPTPGLLERAAEASALPAGTDIVHRAQVLPKIASDMTFTTGFPEQAQPLPWEPNVEDLPALQPRTAAAEQFRRLRSRLLEFRATRQLKTVLVSSALPQEGKSFVAANLAVALNYHRGTRVLLIDGDMRRYTMQNYFGTVHQPGLADFLAGDAEPETIMQRPDDETLAKFPGLSHLTLIGGGGKAEHIADLSEDSRFGELIDYATPMFDWIVVDSSPVTLVTDAVNLARHTDGVLLVVRAGMTPYQAAQKAQSELQASTLLGVVLNGVADKPTPAYYGYGSAEN